jgi:hypothetical protein
MEEIKPKDMEKGQMYYIQSKFRKLRNVSGKGSGRQIGIFEKYGPLGTPVFSSYQDIKKKDKMGFSGMRELDSGSSSTYKYALEDFPEKHYIFYKVRDKSIFEKRLLKSIFEKNTNSDIANTMNDYFTHKGPVQEPFNEEERDREYIKYFELEIKIMEGQLKKRKERQKLQATRKTKSREFGDTDIAGKSLFTGGKKSRKSRKSRKFK